MSEKIDKHIAGIGILLIILILAASFILKDAYALKRAAAYRLKVNPIVAGVFQTGKTIKLVIMRSSDQKRFDFDDSTWKASGWTTKTVILSEETDVDSPYYYYDWTYPATNTANADIVYSFFTKGVGFNFYDIQDISWERLTIGMISN